MKLHFVLADTHRTYIAAVYENEHRPYKRRIVTVELTPEQEEAIKPREVGVSNGAKVYEEILDVFLEEQEAIRRGNAI